MRTAVALVLTVVALAGCRQARSGAESGSPADWLRGVRLPVATAACDEEEPGITVVVAPDGVGVGRTGTRHPWPRTDGGTLPLRPAGLRQALIAAERPAVPDGGRRRHQGMPTLLYVDRATPYGRLVSVLHAAYYGGTWGYRFALERSGATCWRSLEQGGVQELLRARFAGPTIPPGAIKVPDLRLVDVPDSRPAVSASASAPAAPPPPPALDLTLDIDERGFTLRGDGPAAPRGDGGALLIPRHGGSVCSADAGWDFVALRRALRAIKAHPAARDEHSLRIVPAASVCFDVVARALDTARRDETGAPLFDGARLFFQRWK
jgi:hypothetical protein